MARRLHIGGKVRAEGWEVLNANAADYVDHVCNANDLSQFPDNTFVEIYASHIVEHLDYAGGELINTLKEWNRVLTPGGKAYISVPDLDCLAKLILDKGRLNVHERFHVMRMIFGGHTDKYDYHYVGLNEDFLVSFLSGAGYTNIRRVPQFGLFEDTSSLAFKGALISLNIIAEKKTSSTQLAEDEVLLSGNWEGAIRFYEECIEREPETRAHYWRLGLAFLLAERNLEAQGTWFGVLVEAPEQETALWTIELHNVLVAMGTKLLSHQQFGAAERSFQQALELDVPAAELARAHNGLGNVSRQRGDLAGAIDRYEMAIELNPHFGDPHYGLGELYRAQGRSEIAIQSLRRAVEVDPQHLLAPIQLGKILSERGQVPEAITTYQRALAIDRNLGEVQKSLGALFGQQRDYESAIQHLQRSTLLAPGDAETFYNLGLALEHAERLKEAAAAYREAVRVNPDFLVAHNSLGLTYLAMDRFGDALDSFQRSLSIDPSNLSAYNSSGLALLKQGRVRESLKYCHLARGLEGERGLTYINELLTRLYLPENSPEETYAVACDWAEKFTPNTSQYDFSTRDLVPERRLRIGYISPDFRNHAVARFVTPIFANHDRDAFEVFCFAEVKKPDSITQSLQQLAHSWSSTVGRSDAEIAEEIYHTRIDILVDLGGHTNNSRTSIFGFKPAPIQITHIGYPNTTGLATMDYRLTDSIADPVGQGDDYYTEALVRLSNCFLCFDPLVEAPSVSTLPALTKGYVTFGSFNNIAKITPAAIVAWAKILQAVPQARIFFKNSSLADPRTREFLWNLMEDLGVARERVELQGLVKSTVGHLSCYHSIDIALDSFPYNGTTTTCEALWMGVPVIALKGDRHVSRVSQSLLHAVGLTELVTSTMEDYVRKAVALSQDLQQLANLRSQLRPRMAASTLCDAPRYVRNLEATYRQLWEHWCASQNSN